jgi:hypothetical protein
MFSHCQAAEGPPAKLSILLIAPASRELVMVMAMARQRRALDRVANHHQRMKPGPCSLFSAVDA